MARLFASASSQRLVRSDTFGLTDWPMTLAAWVNPTTLSAASILCLGSALGSRDAFIGIDSSNQAVAAKNDSPDAASVSTASTLSTGAWQHICGKFSGDTSMDIFLNGTGKQSTSTTCGFQGNQDQSMVGANTGGGTPSAFFNGAIAEVALWNVALSDEEIAALGKGYSPFLIRRASLIAYYPLRRGDLDGSSHLDRWKGKLDLGEGGTGSPSVSDHPLIIYPS